MFHGPAELLWMGFLTGLIWTQRSKSVALTPKVNSKTYRQKGNFTRDEWNNLFHSCNVSHFSSTCCTKNFSLLSCSTMAKRIQEQKNEERVVSKSRLAAMHLSSPIATSSSSASSPIACKSLGMPISFGETRQQDGKFQLIRRSVDFSSATTGCIPWRVNGKAAGETRRIKKKKIQKTPTILRSGITTCYGENRCPKQ